MGISGTYNGLGISFGVVEKSRGLFFLSVVSFFSHLFNKGNLFCCVFITIVPSLLAVIPRHLLAVFSFLLVHYFIFLFCGSSDCTGRRFYLSHDWAIYVSVCLGFSFVSFFQRCDNDDLFLECVGGG